MRYHMQLYIRKLHTAVGIQTLSSRSLSCSTASPSSRRRFDASAAVRFRSSSALPNSAPPSDAIL
jgi:hypothetical protein